MLDNQLVPTPRLVFATDDGLGAASAGEDPSPPSFTPGAAGNAPPARADKAGTAERFEPPSLVPDGGGGPPAKATPQAPEPVPNAFPDTWRQDMASGDKAFLRMLERFDSPAALAKAYRELTTKLSSGELRAVKPPGPGTSAEQMAGWRAEHGLPENAAAYVAGLTLPDGTIPGKAEEPLLVSFAEQALKSNWTSEQYNRAVGWYFATQDLLSAQQQLADGRFKEKSSADLLREWGSEYAVNRNAIVQFFDRHFPQEFKIDLLNARLGDGRMLANDPAFNKAVLELAKTVNPSPAMLPNSSGAGLSSVESRIAEIEGKYMRATHGSESWKTYWTGEAGAHMQQEYRGLLAAREQARRGKAT